MESKPVRRPLTSSRFGIELAPEVVQADGNAKNLAWRICNAKKVLVCTVSHPFDLQAAPHLVYEHVD